jgi:hypothetical protein
VVVKHKTFDLATMMTTPNNNKQEELKLFQTTTLIRYRYLTFFHWVLFPLTWTYFKCKVPTHLIGKGRSMLAASGMDRKKWAEAIRSIKDYAIRYQFLPTTLLLDSICKTVLIYSVQCETNNWITLSRHFSSGRFGSINEHLGMKTVPFYFRVFPVIWRILFMTLCSIFLVICSIYFYVEHFQFGVRNNTFMDSVVSFWPYLAAIISLIWLIRQFRTDTYIVKVASTGTFKPTPQQEKMSWTGHLPFKLGKKMYQAPTDESNMRPMDPKSGVSVPDAVGSVKAKGALKLCSDLDMLGVISYTSSLHNDYTCIRNRLVFKRPAFTQSVIDAINFARIDFYIMIKDACTFANVHVIGDQDRKFTNKLLFPDPIIYLSCQLVAPMNFQKYLAVRKSKGAPESLIKDLQKCKNDIKNSSVVDNKWFWRSFFIKRELLPFDKRSTTKEEFMRSKDPRNISTFKTQHANVLLSPFMLAVCHLISKIFNKTCNLFYASGVTTLEVDTWVNTSIGLTGGEDFESPYLVIETDGSRWDTHMCQTKLLLEFLVYSMISKWDLKDSRIMTALLAQLHTVGFTRSGIRAHTPGTRKSGDPNTSVGNSILNFLMHLIVFKSFGLTCTIGSEDSLRIMTLGDDNLTIVPLAMLRKSKLDGNSFEQIATKLTDEFVRFGMCAKIKVSDTLLDAEFCSRKFWPVRDLHGNRLYAMGAKPFRLIAKFPYSVNDIPRSQRRTVLYGKLLQVRNEHSFVPVLCDYLDAVEREFVDINEDEAKSAYSRHCERIRKWENLSYSARTYVKTEETLSASRRWYGVSRLILEKKNGSFSTRNVAFIKKDPHL